MEPIYAYVNDLQQIMANLPFDQIQKVVDLLADARMDGNQIFIMGNGGSAATASHFVCDLAKGTRQQSFPPYRVIGLSDNMAIFSAYANDEGYENVFIQQLASLVRPGDIVIGISGSGNSQNVIRAVKYANEVGATTVGFTGLSGGQLRGLVDLSVYIPSDCIEQVEDVHLILEHLICKALRERFNQHERVNVQASIRESVDR
jgi:D-sedoheptulose 7-phosphate isomerase